MDAKFQYLFSPLNIGPAAVRNRMMSLSHETLFGNYTPDSVGPVCTARGAPT